MDWIDRVADELSATPWEFDKRIRAAHKAGCEYRREVSALRDASQIDQGEIVRLKDLCLRAAFYIGVRQGPEVDEEADTLLKELRGET